MTTACRPNVERFSQNSPGKLGDEFRPDFGTVATLRMSTCDEPGMQGMLNFSTKNPYPAILLGNGRSLNHLNII